MSLEKLRPTSLNTIEQGAQLECPGSCDWEYPALPQAQAFADLGSHCPPVTHSQGSSPGPSPEAKVPRLPGTDANQPFRDGETQAFRTQRLAQGHLTPVEGGMLKFLALLSPYSQVRHCSAWAQGQRAAGDSGACFLLACYHWASHQS